MRCRAGIALLLLALAIPSLSAADAQTAGGQGGGPTITIPGLQDIQGTAQNTGSAINAVITGLTNTGTSSGSNTGGSGSTGGSGGSGSTGGSSSGGSGSGGSSGGGSGSGGSTPDPPITNPVLCSTLEEFLNPAPGTTCGTNQPVLNPTGTTTTTTAPPAGGGTPSTTVAPRPAVVIARETAQRTPIPLPSVRTSPPVGRDQLVNLPTWMWVEDWNPRSATATEGPLTVTVVATPRSVTWRMGDGSSIVCGAGRAWNPALREDQQSTDCSYAYTRSSANQPDLVYQARATMTWDVNWTATNGESGNLGQANRSVDFTMRVAEGQAIVTQAGR